MHMLKSEVDCQQLPDFAVMLQYWRKISLKLRAAIPFRLERGSWSIYIELGKTCLNNWWMCEWGRSSPHSAVCCCTAVVLTLCQVYIPVLAKEKWFVCIKCMKRRKMKACFFKSLFVPLFKKLNSCRFKSVFQTTKIVQNF